MSQDKFESNQRGALVTGLLTKELTPQALVPLTQALRGILGFLEVGPQEHVIHMLLEAYTEKRLNLAKAVSSELYWMFADRPELESWRGIQREYDWLKIATSSISCIRNNLILYRAELGSYFVLTGNHLCRRCQGMHGKIVKLTETPEENSGENISADPFAKVAVWFGKTHARIRGHNVVPCHFGFCDLSYTAIDPDSQRYSKKYRKIIRIRSAEERKFEAFLPKEIKLEMRQMAAQNHLRERWAASDRDRGIHKPNTYYGEKMAYYLREKKAGDLPEKYRAEILSETKPIRKKN